MSTKQILVIVSLVAFFLYHPNSANGPDSKVYLAVAHSILTTGSLNILPETPLTGNSLQITRTAHAPIHQNIGGVLFILPAAAVAKITQQIAGLIPGSPESFRNNAYHEAVWCGVLSYLLALSSIFFMYRVARVYHDNSAVIAALISTIYGGPLLVYSAVFPCQTNLPSAFLASLLLFVVHFGDRRKALTWLLMGGVWSLGVFIRLESALWGVLLAYSVVQELLSTGWRGRVRHGVCLGIGCALFIVPNIQVREILFGFQVVPYSIFFDYDILAKSYLMLLGPRNGLFCYWPILLLALFGYLIKFRRNPPIYHAMFVILLLGGILCGSNLYWGGDFGDSFGQRRFLFLLPCFVLFLSRLIELSRKHRLILGILCTVCVLWAVLMFAVYGEVWLLSGNAKGFLKPNHYARMWQLLIEYYPQFFSRAIRFVAVPKHVFAFVLLPIPLFGYYIVQAVRRRFRLQQLMSFGAAGIMAISIIVSLFMVGADVRGKKVFDGYALDNPQLHFVPRTYEVNFEIIGSMADCVAFSLEHDDQQSADHFREKTLSFLKKEAPDQIPVFETICAALQLRHQLGWQRLEPEQNLQALLQWYTEAQAAIREGQPVPDPRSRFLL